MSSGGDEPVADGGGSGHSVFAAALLNGFERLRGGAFTSEETEQENLKQPWMTTLGFPPMVVETLKYSLSAEGADVGRKSRFGFSSLSTV